MDTLVTPSFRRILRNSLAKQVDPFGQQFGLDCLDYMSAWLRRTSGILTLGGGALGITLILTQLMAGYPGSIGLLISVAFIGAYSWGIAAGVLLLEGSKEGLDLSLPYWLAQIPQFSSPWLLFEFSSGARFVVFFRQGDFHVNAIVGSHFNFFIGSVGAWSVGVNVLAITMFALLLRARRSAARRATVVPVVEKGEAEG